MVDQVEGSYSSKDVPGGEAKHAARTLVWALLFSLSVLISLVGFLIDVYDYSWNTGESLGVDSDALLVARLIFYTAISINMLSMVIARTTSMRIASLVLGVAVIARLVSLPG
ncbi:hypothetical protein [Streptosporangium lutulentum]|uniref:Uncharacterized protein n=1 Tax=Streptosporangium lutulentum TaxID=1461250 RepID=A0ABT9QBD5_9ACTN|nr:hypothetical protein [Streptosporangium lutulentum]MDP9843695.1 hypothetical protein [Streptosporangium lutulentum]